MSEKTALYNLHLESKGKIVDFAGFSLPVNYGSQIDEHKAVRNNAGMFDVSHMVVSDVQGLGAKEFLQYLLANNVDKLTQEGKALYSCILNEKGGIIDDLIVYFLSAGKYRIISNAATRDKGLSWMQKIAADFEVKINERSELAMLAIQGPNARSEVLKCLPLEVSKQIKGLGRFYGLESGPWFVGRTGYTGEDGFEVVSSAENIAHLWQNLLSEGVEPCGLGARDSLRMEAGMMLCGTDMTENNSPLESGLAWTVAMKDERNFVGKQALQAQKNRGLEYKMVGLTLTGRGIMRSHQEVVYNDQPAGEVTSGGYSPSLDRSIAFARVGVDVSGTCKVRIRNALVSAKVGGMIFLKNT